MLMGKILNDTILLCVLIIFALLCTFIAVDMRVQPERLFSMPASGQSTPLTAIDAPYNTTGAVLEWASRAAIAAHTYGFNDYDDRLTEASHYFTKAGWADFSRALNESNTIWTVLEKRLDVTSVVVDAPIIAAEGLLLNKYVWKIKVPLLVTYQSLSEKRQVGLIVTMLVQKVPGAEMKHGIGIAQMQVAPISVGAL